MGRPTRALRPGRVHHAAVIDVEVPVPPRIVIRRERAGDAADAAAVRAVHRAAFPSDAEARLLDALRASGDYDPGRSLVAEVDGVIQGHCLLTATTLEHPDGSRVVGRIVALGPIAVVPAWQTQHLGARLIRAVFDRCENEGVAAIVVLGYPSYFPRFGFDSARTLGLLPPEPWPDEAWMARRLAASTPEDVGVVHYAQPFMEMD